MIGEIAANFSRRYELGMDSNAREISKLIIEQQWRAVPKELS